MKKNMNIRLVLSIVLILCTLVSAFVISDYASSPKTHKKTIEFLDDEKDTVLKFTAAAGTASLLISAIPDDTGTPISNVLSGVTLFFGVSLTVIFLEKYMLTLTGFLTFGLLIPVALLLFLISLFNESQWCRKVALRLSAVGVVIFAVVPLSVHISLIIKDTYQGSIDEVYAKIETNTAEIEESVNSENTKEDKDKEVANEDAEEKSFLEGVADTVKDVASSAVETVAGAVTSGYDYAKTATNAFIEGVAIIFAISCLIPLFTLIILVWVVRMICGVNVNLSTALNENDKGLIDVLSDKIKTMCSPRIKKK